MAKSSTDFIVAALFVSFALGSCRDGSAPSATSPEQPSLSVAVPVIQIRTRFTNSTASIAGGEVASMPLILGNRMCYFKAGFSAINGVTLVEPITFTYSGFGGAAETRVSPGTHEDIPFTRFIRFGQQGTLFVHTVDAVGNWGSQTVRITGAVASSVGPYDCSSEQQ